MPKNLILAKNGDYEFNIIESNQNEIIFEEVLSNSKNLNSKNINRKKGIDLEVITLQKKILGKDIRLGSHFNRDEKGNIYLYKIFMYGKNGLIKMKCSNKTCKAKALYNYISKIFYLTKRHTDSLESHKHKMKNNPNFGVVDYIKFLDIHKDISDLQIIKVPLERFCKMNSISYVIENEKNINSSFSNDDKNKEEYKDNK